MRYPDITVKLIGQNGNAFNLLGICAKEMRRAKLPKEEVDEFMRQAQSGDYNHLLATIGEWFEIR